MCFSEKANQDFVVQRADRLEHVESAPAEFFVEKLPWLFARVQRHKCEKLVRACLQVWEQFDCETTAVIEKRSVCPPISNHQLLGRIEGKSVLSKIDTRSVTLHPSATASLRIVVRLGTF